MIELNKKYYLVTNKGSLYSTIFTEATETGQYYYDSINGISVINISEFNEYSGGEAELHAKSPDKYLNITNPLGVVRYYESKLEAVKLARKRLKKEINRIGNIYLSYANMEKNAQKEETIKKLIDKI